MDGQTYPSRGMDRGKGVIGVAGLFFLGNRGRDLFGLNFLKLQPGLVDWMARVFGVGRFYSFGLSWKTPERLANVTPARKLRNFSRDVGRSSIRYHWFLSGPPGGFFRVAMVRG